MKKNAAMLLALITVLVSVLMTSCDIGKTDWIDLGEVHGGAATSCEETVNGPVEVDGINGKNGRQLYEEYLKKIENATQLDICVFGTQLDDGKSEDIRFEMQIDGSSNYLSMLDGDGLAKIWSVDGMLYADMYGEKYRAKGITVADVLGEDFLDEFFGEFISEVPDEYLEKLEKSQMYMLDGEYYVTVELTAAEAKKILGEDVATKETLYFDENGALKRSESSSEKETVNLTINSIGMPLNITKPVDASTFKLRDDLVGGQDPTVYAKYEALFEKVEKARCYYFDMYVDESLLMTYGIDLAKDQYVCAVENGDFYEVWEINNKIYVSLNGSEAVESSKTQQTQEMFDSVSDNKSIFSGLMVNKLHMRDLKLSYNTDVDANEISFYAKNGNSTGYYYLWFDDDMTYIELRVEIVSGTQSETCNYVYTEIDNVYMDIY